MNLPLIPQGKRAILAGRTGSGKSTLACWMLENSPGHWFILNPKHTKAYDRLPDSVVVKSAFDFGRLEREIQRHRFVVVNPEQTEASFEGMDYFAQWVHDEFRQVGLCCDELYTMHRNGVAGAGLLAYLTRGRELGQSFFGQTQRPAWVSQFVFSESDYIGEMSLNLDKDRKRMVEFIGHPAAMENLPPHYWLWYDITADNLRRFAPVPLPPKRSIK